jgi:hypothetical protein
MKIVLPLILSVIFFGLAYLYYAPSPPPQISVSEPTPAIIPTPRPFQISEPVVKGPCILYKAYLPISEDMFNTGVEVEAEDQVAIYNFARTEVQAKIGSFIQRGNPIYFGGHKGGVLQLSGNGWVGLALQKPDCQNINGETATLKYWKEDSVELK